MLHCDMCPVSLVTQGECHLSRRISGHYITDYHHPAVSQSQARDGRLWPITAPGPGQGVTYAEQGWDVFIEEWSLSRRASDVEMTENNWQMKIILKSLFSCKNSTNDEHKKRKYAAEKFYTRSICPKLYFNIPDCETCQHDGSGIQIQYLRCNEPSSEFSWISFASLDNKRF